MKSVASLEEPERFSAELIDWQKNHGRHTLPWQNTQDAYRIWLSEIMLQQTQVVAVIAYYLKFLQRFPDVFSLAAAPIEEVMVYWSGLGYYARARNLHRCACQIVADYDGTFPNDPALLAELPGIGRSTAAAIAAFSFGTRAAIMDGNVKRVFARVFGIDTYPGERKTEQRLWQLAESLLPDAELQSYTQGLMDLGATICIRSKPACERCPMAPRCIALATGRVAELPVRKPKKVVPEKHAVMLVVVHSVSKINQGQSRILKQQILLIRRPQQGIWGGLLSLPTLGGFTAVADGACHPSDMKTDLPGLIQQYLSPFGDVAACNPLQPFSHGFTHFKLHVTPYQVTVEHVREAVGESDYSWADVEELDTLALPAPIRKLLQELFRSDCLFAA